VPSAAYHRHDLSDSAWELLSPHLPGRSGQWGGIARDNRQFLNAVLWILRTSRRGAIFLRTTAIGKTPIAVFVVGATGASGKGCSNNWSMSPISNG
jgi:transposase